MTKTLFVTVGSTKFDALINHILQNLTELKRLGFERLILQTGKSKYNPELLKDTKLKIETYDYKSSILDDIKSADLVVGHAGAGTCLEVLRLNKRMLVVINETLMDNHQSELADKLEAENYLLKSNVMESIDKLRSIFDHKFKKFPSIDKSNFEQIFDKSLKSSLMA